MQQDGSAQPGAGLGEILSLAGFLPPFPQENPSPGLLQDPRSKELGMCVRLGQGHGVVLAPCMAAGPGP